MPELVHWLTLVALVAATLQYAVLMRHREERREAVRWQAEAREALISAGGTDPSHAAGWMSDGTRY